MNEMNTKEINSIEEVKNIFQDVYNQTAESRAVLLDKIRLLQESVEVLRENMPEPPNWITDLVEPIAQLVANELKVSHFKVIEIKVPPNSVKVSFFNKDEEELYEIILIPEDLAKSLILYKTGEKDGKKYEEGTIGALIHMNDKTAPLPLNDIKDVANIIRNL